MTNKTENGDDTQTWSKEYPLGAAEVDMITENNDRATGSVAIDPYGSVTTTTNSYSTSDPGFDNNYNDLGPFTRNGSFPGYSKGYWWSDVQPPLGLLAGYAESGLASGVTPAAFTPMGGISNASPNIIQPTTNVPMPAPAGHNTAGSPAGPSQASAPAAPSTSFWSYLPGAIGETISNGASELGNRLLDGVNDINYVAGYYTGLNTGVSNQHLSNLSTLQDSGQTSWGAAQLSTLPVVGNGYNAITGKDLLTGQDLNGWQRAGAGFGAIADGALLAAGAEGEASGDVPPDEVPTPSAVGDEAANAAEQPKIECGNTGCFRMGTKVLRPIGLSDIETVAIGQKLFATDRDEAGPKIDPNTHSVIKLSFVKDGQEFLLSFLRPTELFRNTRVGDNIQLSVLELKVQGPARVLAIEPCPPIEEGIGHIVTGFFSVRSANRGRTGFAAAGAGKPRRIQPDGAV